MLLKIVNVDCIDKNFCPPFSPSLSSAMSVSKIDGK